MNIGNDMKIHELLSDESKFARGIYSSTNSERSMYTSPIPNPNTGVCLAERWDIMGALSYCYHGTPEFERIYKMIWTHPLIRQWAENHKRLLKEEERARLKKNANVDWVIFNDCAPHNEIHAALKAMDI